MPNPVPVGGGGGGSSEVVAPKKKKKQQEPTDVWTTKVAAAQGWTGPTLPPAMGYSVGLTAESDNEAARAAATIARHVQPRLTYAPGHQVLIDPLTGSPISLKRAKALSRNGLENSLTDFFNENSRKLPKVYQRRRGAVPSTIDPSRIAQYVRAMDSVGNVDAGMAVGVAIQAAQQEINPDVFKTNLTDLAAFNHDDILDENQLLQVARIWSHRHPLGDRMTRDQFLSFVMPDVTHALEIAKQRSTVVGVGTSYVQAQTHLKDIQLLSAAIKDPSLLPKAEALAREIIAQDEKVTVADYITGAVGAALDTSWKAMNQGLTYLAGFGVLALREGEALAPGGMDFRDAFEQTRKEVRYVSQRVEQGEGIGHIVAEASGLPGWMGSAYDFAIGWEADPLIWIPKLVTANRVLRLAPALAERETAGNAIVRRLFPGITDVRRDAQVARWETVVDRFSGSRISKNLYEAAYKSDEELMRTIDRLTHNMEARSPLDYGYMLQLRDELLKMYPRRSEGAWQEWQAGMRQHFGIRAPENSVAGRAYTRRQGISLEAEEAYNELPFQPRLFEQTDSGLVPFEATAKDLGEDVMGRYSDLALRLETPTRIINPRKRMALRAFEEDAAIFGSRTNKQFFNVNPGNIFRPDIEPERFIWLKGIRTRQFSEPELQAYRVRAAKIAAEGVGRERKLVDLYDELQHEASLRYASKVGVSAKDMDPLLHELEGPTKNFNQRAFGALPSEYKLDAPRKIEHPLFETELRNEYVTLDWVQIKGAIDRYAGTIKRLENAVIRNINKIPFVDVATTEARRQAIIALHTPDIAKDIAHGIARTWKAMVVPRPAYVGRVVLGDEFARSITTVGSLYERITAQDLKLRIPFGKELATGKPRYVNLGYVLDKTGVGEESFRIGDEVITLKRAGLERYEPLANTVFREEDLIDDMLRHAIRNEKLQSVNGSWDVLRPGNKGYYQAWQRDLNEQMAQSIPGRVALQAVVDGHDIETTRRVLWEWAKRDKFRILSGRIGISPKRYEVGEWADDVARLAHSYTGGDPALARLALERKVELVNLKKVPSDLRPPVHGPLVASLTGRDQGVLKRAVEGWYDLWVKQPENMLNRQPFYRIWKRRAERSYYSVLAKTSKDLEGDIRVERVTSFPDEVANTAVRGRGEEMFQTREWWAYQNTHLEPIPKMLDDRDLGSALEASMDAGREIAFKGADARDLGYLDEKLDRVEMYLSGSYRTFEPADSERLVKLINGISDYSGETSPALTLANEMTYYIADGNFDAARQKLAELRSVVNAGTTEVDAPLRLYHGTKNGFDDFSLGHAQPGIYGRGIYLAEDPKVAASYSEFGGLGPLETRTFSSEAEARAFADKLDVAMETRNGQTTPYLTVRENMLWEQLDGGVIRWGTPPKPTGEWYVSWVPAPHPNVHNVYVDIRHPFDATKPLDPEVANRITEAAKEEYDQAVLTERWTPYDEEDLHAILNTMRDPNITGEEFYHQLESLLENDDDLIRGILNQEGFDGIFHIGRQDGRVWIAFSESQVHQGVPVVKRVTVGGEPLELTKEMKNAVDQMSREFALAQTKKVMFDFTENTRLGELVAGAIPFTQPWAEAYAAWGYIALKRNPALGGYIRQLYRDAHDTGLFFYDENGETRVDMSFLAPMLALFNIPGVEEGYKLSAPLNAFNLFFSQSFTVPGTGIPIPTPGLAPWASLPLKYVLKDTKNTSVAHWLFEYGPGTELVPAWMQYATRAVKPDAFNDPRNTATAQDFLRLYQFLGTDVDKDGNPLPANVLIDRAESDAQKFNAVKGVFGLFSPGAVQIQFPYQEQLDEFQAIVEKHPEDYSKAVDIFLKKYPELTLLTVGKTSVATTLGGEEAPRVPASEYAAKLLNEPGFKQFAQRYPAWAAAVVLQSDANNEFDMNAFGRQVAEGEVQYKDLGTFLTGGQAPGFWEAINTIYGPYNKKLDRLEGQGLSDDNEAIVALKRELRQNLYEISQRYPLVAKQAGLFPLQDSAGNEIDESQWLYGEDRIPPPIIYKQAREIVKLPSVRDFPAIKGLREYLNLRDDYAKKLSNAGITSIDSPYAERLGWTKEFEKGKDSIIKEFPESGSFIYSFFDNDLAVVETSGDKRLRRMEKRNPEKYAEYVRFETGMENRSDAPTALIGLTEEEKNARYEIARQHINGLYERGDQWKIQTWWDSRSYGEQKVYRETLINRPPIFYSRFDWSLMGVKLTATGADWMNAVTEAGQTIDQMEAAATRQGKDLVTTPLHEQVDAWVRAHLGQDKSFDAAVNAVNTWGWALWQNDDLMKQKGKAGWAWRTLRDLTVNLNQQVINAGLHGDGLTFGDPKDTQAYTLARDALGDRIKEYAAWSPVFAEQVRDLQKGALRGEQLQMYLMPEIYFALGGKD